MSEPKVLLEIDDRVATVTLNRPEALNALNSELSEDLTRAIDEIKARAGDSVKAVVLTGAGRAFCSGGDIKSMNNEQRTPEAQRRRLRASHARIQDVMHLELPVVSLVHGAAAGAGANIALAADFVIATPKAMFMQAFGRIGLVPDWGGMYVLPRLVGLQRAKELIFTARRVGAEEALKLGMVTEIVPEAGALAHAQAFARRFAAGSTTAIGLAKNILNQSHNLDLRQLLELEASAQGICVESDFHREAVRRFASKETPLYDWDSV
ncbi:MAG: enoyl-CoA hydratase/isomerase family protein [Pseudomonadota bacterium]